MTIYWLPSNGAIIQCGRKAHAIKAGRTSRVQHIASLWVGFKEAGDVVVDFSVGLHKLARSEWFSDEVSGSPLFKGVVVL